jgi:hypothetical protein
MESAFEISANRLAFSVGVPSLMIAWKERGVRIRNVQAWHHTSRRGITQTGVESHQSVCMYDA